jgi:hypothetical protein
MQTIKTKARASRKFLSPFVLGVMVKEIFNFKDEGGFTDVYPLARSLFSIILCVTALLLMWTSDETDSLHDRITALEKTQKNNLGSSEKERALPQK